MTINRINLLCCVIFYILHKTKYSKLNCILLSVSIFNVAGSIFSNPMIIICSILIAYELSSDKIIENPEDMEKNIFGDNYGVITDIEIGQDGYIYVLSKTNKGGKISKILESIL